MKKREVEEEKREAEGREKLKTERSCRSREAEARSKLKREKGRSGREPITSGGSRGVHEGPGHSRMRGGRGNARSRSDAVPSFSFTPFARPFSPFLLSLSISLAFSTAPDFPSSSAIYYCILSLLGLRNALSLQRRCLGEDRRSRPSAHDPRPRGHGVIRSGVLNIWVIGVANG